MNDSWYLRSSAYYVNDSEASAYPNRQGDVFEGIEVNGERWNACQLVHPTCELAKGAVKQLHVIRVHSIAEVADKNQQSAICTGWTEKDGQIRVAFAHTFFLAPVRSVAGGDPLFSNFREIAQIDRELILDGHRVASLTHEARVSFIRRMIYFAYRMRFAFNQVQEWEAARIAADPDFQGPKPAWATK